MDDHPEETAAAEVVATPARPIEAARTRELAPRPAGQVAAQAAAVAATTFVAGAGLAAIVKNRGSRKAVRRFRRRRKDLPILATRSFLIDVHLLDR